MYLQAESIIISETKLILSKYILITNQKLKYPNNGSVEQRLKPLIRRLVKHRSSKCEVLKHASQCYKDNEISKQKCSLVQVAGSHWKHMPVTNANYFGPSQSITKKLYLDACIKSIHTTGAS